MEIFNELINIYQSGEFDKKSERINEIISYLNSNPNIEEIICQKLSNLKKSIIDWKNQGAMLLENQQVFTSQTQEQIFETLYEILIKDETHSLSFSSKSIMFQNDIVFHIRINEYLKDAISDIEKCDNSINCFINVLIGFDRFKF